MKKFVRVFTALGLALLLVISINSFAKKKPGKTIEDHPAGITYIVTVDQMNGGLCYAYNVVIRDEIGNLICSPLQYHEGINNYIFHESGPVLGSRIARLERIDGQGHYFCNSLVIISPDQLTGKFRNGSTYMFNLATSISPGHD